MTNGIPPEPRDWWGPLAPLGEAIRFLTLLPVPGMPPMTEQSIARSIPFFPLVGTLLGMLLALVGAFSGLFWGDAARAVLVVTTWGILTSGLHLDGLSDTFDGVMSWRSRERKLEIMKDSRIGAMGAMALVAVLGLKAAFLYAAGDGWFWALLLAPALGRWADVYGIVAFPVAREGGLGRSFQEQLTRRDSLVVTALTVALALLLAGTQGLVAMALVWLVATALARWWVHTLGGLTGDTYGALCEIGEVVALAALSASLS